MCVCVCAQWRKGLLHYYPSTRGGFSIVFTAACASRFGYETQGSLNFLSMRCDGLNNLSCEVVVCQARDMV